MGAALDGDRDDVAHREGKEGGIRTVTVTYQGAAGQSDVYGRNVPLAVATKPRSARFPSISTRCYIT